MLSSTLVKPDRFPINTMPVRYVCCLELLDCYPTALDQFPIASRPLLHSTRAPENRSGICRLKVELIRILSHYDPVYLVGSRTDIYRIKIETVVFVE